MRRGYLPNPHSKRPQKDMQGRCCKTQCLPSLRLPPLRTTRFTRKGLQSKRVTASLLIKNQFMQEKIVCCCWVQKSKNLLCSCLEGEGLLSPAKRHCMGVCAVENSMLFILDIIISFTQITGRGGAGVPCCGLKAKGVDTQSKTGNTLDDTSWEV